MRATFSIDESSLLALERSAAALNKSKSEIVREAVIEYDARRDRLSEKERQAKLSVISKLSSLPPDRTEDDVQTELAEIQVQRHEDQRNQ